MGFYGDFCGESNGTPVQQVLLVGEKRVFKSLRKGNSRESVVFDVSTIELLN